MSPLFDFQCDDCQKYIEAIIPLKDWDKVIECPHCHKPLKRVCIKPPRVASWNRINGAKVM